MGTRYNRLAESVLTSIHNLCFEQKYEKINKTLSENFQFFGGENFNIFEQACFRNVKGIDTLSGEGNSVKMVYLPFKEWSTLKRQNLHPIGAYSLLSEKSLFQRRIGAQESQQEVTNVVFSSL